MPKRTSPIKNKGIAEDKRKRKRLEAEERNAKTPPENRRQVRLAAMLAVKIASQKRRVKVGLLA
jgi:hypothetical protein